VVSESFQALLAAINRLAAQVDLPLDVAAGLLQALGAYTEHQVAAERERCARLALDAVGDELGLVDDIRQGKQP